MYSSSSSNSATQEIKMALLKFHKNRGYRLFESFPLVSTDPTVMFINATITPFKSWFTDSSIRPDNYALIQGCLRMGGASDFDSVGTNPYYFTFFEMFGSGTFQVNHDEAVAYLMELLAVLGIKKNQLYFTIPSGREFRVALKRNGIKESRIFRITKNESFWQEWKFGIPGPAGHGLTVIVSRSSKNTESVKQLADDPNRYIELLNLIYVNSQSLPDSKLVPISNPGFDLGMGIERFAAVLQECNSYQIDAIFPLVQTIKDFLSGQKKERVDDVIARICADHFRAIYILLAQGLAPSNKGCGYILRKLMRRFLETIWLSLGAPAPVDRLIQNLSNIFKNCGYIAGVNEFKDATNKILKEESAFLGVLKRAEKIIRQHPDISPEILYDTYGISKSLLALIQQNRYNRKGD